jgi:hypothetical protein
LLSIHPIAFRLCQTYLMVIAEKLRADASIHTTPQQSDYENALWQGHALTAWSRRMAVLNRIKQASCEASPEAYA